MEETIKALSDAGGSVVAIAALVYVTINQLTLMRSMQEMIDKNTRAVEANTQATQALGTIINNHK